MDRMDIDHTEDVPDTPDRLDTQGINRRSDVKEENRSSSMPCHPGQQKFFEEGAKNQPMVIDIGSRKLPMHPPKCTSSSNNSLHPINYAAFSLAGSSSSRSDLLFRKGVTDKNPRYQSHDSVHTQHRQNVRSSRVSKSRSSQDDSFVDLTERNHLHRPVFENAFPGGVPGNIRAEFRERSGLATGASSSHGWTNSSTASSNANEETDNISRVGSGVDCREGAEFVRNIQNKPVNGDSLSLDPTASPRVNKQKRLVRNGCISPNNIAKANQLAGKDINGSVAVEHNNSDYMASSAPHLPIDIRELVAEDNDSHRGKGKGVISHPCSSKEPDFKNKNLCSRSPTSSHKKDMETSDYVRGLGKSTEESGGWRSTRNRAREMDISSSNEEQYVTRESDGLRCTSQHHENRMERRDKGIRIGTGDDYPTDLNSISYEHARTQPSRCTSRHHENRMERREKGISIGTGDDYPKDLNSISYEHACTQPSRESVSHPRARLGRLNGHRSNPFIKRQKQRSNLSSFGECSASASDDPEVVYLSSSAEAAKSKSTSSSMDNIQPIIEVDEYSPQLRRNAHDEETKSRQVEADELLARELQEQLYNEVPVFGVGELDEHIALALQHQDDSSHDFSRARHPVLDARGSSMSNLRRQSQSWSSSNPPRRGSQARASTLGRMTRLRSRFPGQPRTLLSSRGRTSLFPAEMDVDMRMHILGALEEFSDMGVGTGILQTQRDFNENDYEMLLALDENNDQHGGASIRHINGLPQSTVQSDNFEEACAICLETPTIGDTIRHLPCLHKFHKDCIDPWLRRRTSCPVCKSSIT